VEGYRTLYSLRIIHRDIKPANFLLKKEEIKLSDFGMGRVVEDMKERLKLTKVGTPAYAAP
jgi:serine/threonine protein kinase